ncbi:hypothetical protein BC832DRAFT_557037 [Gaertneriomyces semiglobifer]|nr:hypothetical protein BC832DRAFT_557037 [Gaertneriomyces semiglobifer]
MADSIVDAPVPETGLEPNSIPSPLTAVHLRDLRPLSPPPVRTLLFGHDASPMSTRALDWAVTTMVRPGDALVILFSLPEAFPLESAMFTGVDVVDEVKDGQDRATKGMQDLVEEIRKRTGSDVRVEGRLVYGDARDVLCQGAESLRATMLILGSRGRGNLKSLLMGSVSNYCMHHAKVPVVVYRSPEDM